MIVATTRTHLLSTEVETQCYHREAREEIDDGAALAIASYWQGPDGPGATFAQLASTGSVDLDALLDAIAAHRHFAIAYDRMERTRIHTLELDMLATWALNHPTREA